MKFISWLFGISKRYYRQGYRYSRGGVGNRVFNLALITIIAAVSLVLEFFSLDMFFKQGQVLGIFLMIIAFIMVIGVIELCAVYSFFGFRSASAGSLDKWLNKAGSKAKNRKQEEIQSQVVSQDAETGAEITNQTTEEQTQTPKRKTPKWLDIFSGVYFLVLAIAELALAVVFLGMVI